MKLEKGVASKKELPIEIKDMGDRRVLFTISKEVVDRDGDILRASGCDLTNYLKNKVFLGFHNSRDFPLGKTEDIWIEADRVKAIVYFPTVEELSTNPEQASEKAKLTDFCYCCYKTGMLNAVSVGFIPLEWIETENGYDILKWELLEFSAVAVPANQDAIAEAVKSFGVDFAKSFITEEKSGRKISAQTRAILDKIKACGDELEKCQETLKGCGEALRKALAELDEPEPEEDTEEEKQYVELPDSIEVELPS